MCVVYEAGNIPQEEWGKHQKKTNEAREEKERDKEQAKRKKIACIVLLQQWFKDEHLIQKVHS